MLSVELACTVFSVIISMNSSSIMNYMQNNMGLFIFCFVVQLVIFITLACYESVAR